MTHCGEGWVAWLLDMEISCAEYMMYVTRLLLRRARIQSEKAIVFKRLQSDVDDTRIPDICRRYGWGWGRLGIIKGLNEHVLSTWLDAIIADGPLLASTYDAKVRLVGRIHLLAINALTTPW